MESSLNKYDANRGLQASAEDGWNGSQEATCSRVWELPWLFARGLRAVP